MPCAQASGLKETTQIQCHAWILAFGTPPLPGPVIFASLNPLTADDVYIHHWECRPGAADVYIRPRLCVSEMIRELADLECQDTQTGDLHRIDMYHSCGGGGKCKEVHVWARIFVIFCEVKTKMSERRPRIQSGEALNLVLLDPGSGLSQK